MGDGLLSKTLCQWLKCSAAVEAVEPQPNFGSSGSAGIGYLCAGILSPNPAGLVWGLRCG